MRAMELLFENASEKMTNPTKYIWMTEIIIRRNVRSTMVQIALVSPCLSVLHELENDLLAFLLVHASGDAQQQRQSFLLRHILLRGSLRDVDSLLVLDGASLPLARHVIITMVLADGRVEEKAENVVAPEQHGRDERRLTCLGRRAGDLSRAQVLL